MKNGVDYKFCNGDYIKIDPLYKDHAWFSDKPYKIIKLVNDIKNTFHPEEFYVLDSYSWKELNYSLAVQDNECLRLNRKEKIKKLNKDE